MALTVRSGGVGTTVKAAVPASSDSGNIEIILQALIKNMATKSDLKAAVKTILRGVDVTVSKPRHRKNPARRQQIKAALEYQNSHAGCSLHNACVRSFVQLADGYSSAKSLYRTLLRNCQPPQSNVA